MESTTLPYLGEYLLEKGLISPEDMQKAEAFRSRIGGRLGSILIRIGAISEDSLLNVFSELFEMRIAAPGDLPNDPKAHLAVVEESGIDVDWWLDQEALGWTDEESGELKIIARDPLSDSLAEVVHRVFADREVEFLLVSTYDLERSLEAVGNAQTDHSGAPVSDIDMLRELAEEAPVIEFVNNLLSQAFEQSASDVHVEPGERVMEIRFRIDGVLYTRFTLPSERFPAISSRIKLISGMDIAERRLPQDGRLGIRLSGQEIDIRVSAAPGVHGESIVMRLLPKEREGFSLEDLGLANDHYEMMNAWSREPHGILLVTGPTGSGKSTTLYAVLEAINNRKTKIITVEDPVEYQLEGITQIQTHAEIGYTFGRALRTILRQDPDVIMIGEIRDLETAEIAVQASLTGHLVFSTLHTNDAVSAFTRLIDMGIEPFLVATPVRAVMAQRLVRTLCPACSAPSSPVDDILTLGKELAQRFHVTSPPNFREAKGCSQCHGMGYKGRIGIYEMIPVTPEIQTLILNGEPTAKIQREAKKQFRFLRDDGLLKAYQGITSIEEVLRVTSE